MQYVAILSGLGGDPSFYFSAPKGGMLWVFAVDGKLADTMPATPFPSSSRCRPCRSLPRPNRLRPPHGPAAAATDRDAAAGAPRPAAEALTNPLLGDAGPSPPGRAYRTRCYICHLNQGGRGPNLFATTLTDEQFLIRVINGRKGAPMPAFGLQMSPDEVWEVNAYVRSTDHYE